MLFNMKLYAFSCQAVIYLPSLLGLHHLHEYVCADVAQELLHQHLVPVLPAVHLSDIIKDFLQHPVVFFN